MLNGCIEVVTILQFVQFFLDQPVDDAESRNVVASARSEQRALWAGRETATRCLHFTAGCTTGWVNYANEPSQAALERSSQDAYDIIRLTRSKAAVWTVDDVASLIEIF